jgi:hypothetical protein
MSETLTPEQTDHILMATTSRLHGQADKIAARLRETAEAIDREATRARRDVLKPPVAGRTTAARFVTNVLHELASLHGHLSTEALVDAFAEVLAVELALVKDAVSVPALRSELAEALKLAQYTTHSPDCDKHPQRALHVDETACTCGLNELLGLTPTEN